VAQEHIGMDELRQGTPTELWHALVLEGEQKRNLALGEELESYLVFALMRHLGDDTMATRILALDWLQASAAQGQQGADALREVGDRCLLVAGLFPSLAERRCVDSDYFVRLGRGAYAGAAGCTRRAEATLLARLVEGFHTLVDVLRALGPHTGHQALAPMAPQAVPLGRH
jgi:hypothetical protein